MEKKMVFAVLMFIVLVVMNLWALFGSGWK